MAPKAAPKRSVTHATFTIARTYPQPPAKVFNAFADPKIKFRWFASHPENWERGPYAMDFRVGGRESASGQGPGHPKFTFDNLYWDIVPDERIVFTYDMTLDGQRISVSLTTIEFKPEGKGTKLVFIEHGAYLDGWDKPELREQGTNELLDWLGKELAAS